MDDEGLQKRIYLFIRNKRRRLVFLHTKYFCPYSFIHINKTGGSSIEKALHAPLIHETALTFRERIGRRRWEERFSFAIVRNPWDRAVSHFHYRKMTNQTGLRNTPMGFKDWLKRVYIERSPESGSVTNRGGSWSITSADSKDSNRAGTTSVMRCSGKGCCCRM
jgi:hypothetical protein